MRTLASLLEGAVRRAASEVTLESGQPVVYTTERGTEAETSILARTELFDMIVASVNEAQQIELAVGNPVEFELDGGASWTVYAEPGMEGITVRAQRRGELGAPSLEITLDHTPDPFAAPSLPEPEFGVDPFEVSDRSRSRSRTASRLDVEALEVPILDEGIGASYVDVAASVGAGAAEEPAPGSAFESGTWALADEDEFEVGVDEDPAKDSLPLGFTKEPESLYEDFGSSEDSYSAGSVSEGAGESGGYIGVPSDDDEDGFDPFEPSLAPDPDIDRRRTLSPTVRAMDASAPKRPAPPAMAATHEDLGAMSPTQRSTVQDLSLDLDAGQADMDTHRELPSLGADGLGADGFDALGADLDEGTLVYVGDHGYADALVEASSIPSMIVSEGLDLTEAWSRASAMPVGAILIVRVDDPSPLLGWILRRLEEGYRVFVETRARSAAGARRILLGVGSSERAERWLDGQVAVSLEPGEDGPRLVAC